MKITKKLLITVLTLFILAGCSLNTNKMEQAMEKTIPAAVTLSDEIIGTLVEGAANNIENHKEEFPAVLAYTAPDMNEEIYNEEYVVKNAYNAIMSFKLAGKADANNVKVNSDHYYHFIFADNVEITMIVNNSGDNKYLYSWVDDAYYLIENDNGLFDIDMKLAAEDTVQKAE